MLVVMLMVAALLVSEASGLDNQTIFKASGASSAGCYRSPTLLATDTTLLAFAAHHWDTHESNCNDVGLKAIVVRSTIDGVTCVHPRLWSVTSALPHELRTDGRGM